MSLTIQADIGSSLAEAPRCVDQLGQQLGVLEKMPGPLERSTNTQYKARFTDINENEVAALGRKTYQQSLNDEVENKRKISIACKAVKVLDESLSERLGIFC